MAIHTKTLNVSTDNIFDEIISFFENYWDDITVEEDEQDSTKLYFKEDTDKRAMLVYAENKINFTIYGSSEEVYRNITLPYGSSYVAQTLYLTATSKGVNIDVKTSYTSGRPQGFITFGKSRDNVNFVISGASTANLGGGNVEYYLATGNTNSMSLTVRSYMQQKDNYTWLINLPVGMNEGLVDYANGVYIPITYQILGNTFPYIFRTNLMVNCNYITLDDGPFVG